MNNLTSSIGNVVLLVCLSNATLKAIGVPIVNAGHSKIFESVTYELQSSHHKQI